MSATPLTGLMPKVFPCDLCGCGTPGMYCTTAAVEDAILSVIRHVGIKAGVAPEVYGAMCHEVRAILKGQA